MNLIRRKEILPIRGIVQIWQFKYYNVVFIVATKFHIRNSSGNSTSQFSPVIHMQRCPIALWNAWPVDSHVLNVSIL